MDKFKIENILKIKSLESELELEQANSLFNKLRILQKVNPSMKLKRQHLANLIEAYENEHWSDSQKVTKLRIDASNRAGNTVNLQNQFIQRRKELIKKALKTNGLLQKDLADILSHGNGYTSELINGVRPFSQDDIIIVHKVLGIELRDLIIPMLKEPKLKRVQLVLREKKKNNPKLKIADKELETT